MELDLPVSPEEIMSREMELGCESWTFSLRVVPQQQCNGHCLCGCPGTAVKQQLQIGIRKRSHRYLETRSNVKRQHELTRTDNQRQKYIEKKKKNHLLLRISAVIGRYGSHLMIVMIFVTQNNF